ncbi:MAG: PAS domain S-box protein [Deltaproteobacteria bacterium]|nr:PAS domain S-box protein [Deltaproteobacteria bacterium]
MPNTKPPALHHLFDLPPGVMDRFCQTVLDNARLFAVALEPGGRVVFANRRLADLMGRAGESLVGEDWLALFVPEEHRSEVRAVMARLLESDEPRHHSNAVQGADGRQRLVEWDNAVLRDPKGAPLYLLSFGNDVTDRQQASEELRRSVARHQNILDHAVNGVVTIDQQGLVQEFNRAAVRIFGWKVPEIIGQNVSVLMPSPDREQHDEYIRRYVSGGPPRIIGAGREVLALRRDGTVFPLFLGVSETREPDGSRLFTAVCQDLTERKLGEQALRRAHRELQDANDRLLEEQAKQLRAEKLSSIGLLASGMAHEINNPLMGIISCVKALREGSINTERREDYFEAVRDGLERIQMTVRSLLDYSRQRPPSPEAIAPIELIDACLRLLSPAIRKKDLQITTRVHDPALMLFADRSQLMQALANLMLNAIYALSPRGHIVVSAERIGERVALSVADDGPGIEPEVLHKVCDPFFTTKPIGEGTGLGLAVTLGIARAHRGDLEIKSTVGQGTEVILWLPVHGL